MYSETLMNQWTNLYSDFAGEYEEIKKQGNEPYGFNRWYEARIHRWSSIAYSEGMILEQEKKPDFSNELIQVMKNFSFKKVESTNESKVWIGIIIGIVVGGLTGGILGMIHWGIIKSVLSGIILFAVIAASYSKKCADDKRKEDSRVKKEYIQQLREYQRNLMDVCTKYNVD